MKMLDILKVYKNLYKIYKNKIVWKKWPKNFSEKVIYNALGALKFCEVII